MTASRVTPDWWVAPPRRGTPSVDHGDSHESVTDHATERNRERAEHVEHALDETESLVHDRKFPTSAEELAAEYADHPLELVNETESLGSVFDRMTDQRTFDSAEQVREALSAELTESEPESDPDRP